MAIISIRTYDGGQDTIKYDKNPHECPHCHRSITPRLQIGFKVVTDVGIVFQCPDVNCEELFIAYYKYSHPQNHEGLYRFRGTSAGTVKVREFTEEVTSISKSFIDIYNQSLRAEGLALHHVCGMGYRKALEFLIKDYLISLHPEKEEVIKKKLLGNCIKEYVANPNLKDMAERAAWLGNDETHYTKRWNDKDINDLKLLIDVTLHWIQMDVLTVRYKEAMQQ